MMGARIIADSKHFKLGTRITTFELSFPRWILAEFNTHRLLSRNSASSRAIPIKANIENIMADTAMPVHWGVNQPGMVADAEANEEITAVLAKYGLTIQPQVEKADLDVFVSALKVRLVDTTVKKDD